MRPEDVLTAAQSINQLEEIGSWAPDTSKPTYLVLSAADPSGSVRDPHRLFLRLTRPEIDTVVHALLAYHERRLELLGVKAEDAT